VVVQPPPSLPTHQEGVAEFQKLHLIFWLHYHLVLFFKMSNVDDIDDDTLYGTAADGSTNASK